MTNSILSRQVTIKLNLFQQVFHCRCILCPGPRNSSYMTFAQFIQTLVRACVYMCVGLSMCTRGSVVQMKVCTVWNPESIGLNMAFTNPVLLSKVSLSLFLQWGNYSLIHQYQGKTVLQMEILVKGQADLWLAHPNCVTTSKLHNQLDLIVHIYFIILAILSG